MAASDTTWVNIDKSIGILYIIKKDRIMTITEIKREIDELLPEHQDEIAAYIVHLKHRRDPSYKREMASRINDNDPKNG